MVETMHNTAVHDIDELSGLLERVASIHAGGVRDTRSLIEDFVGLIGDFHPGAALRRPRLTAA